MIFFTWDKEGNIKLVETTVGDIRPPPTSIEALSNPNDTGILPLSTAPFQTGKIIGLEFLTSHELQLVAVARYPHIIQLFSYEPSPDTGLPMLDPLDQEIVPNSEIVACGLEASQNFWTITKSGRFEAKYLPQQTNKDLKDGGRVIKRFDFGPNVGACAVRLHGKTIAGNHEVAIGGPGREVEVWKFVGSRERKESDAVKVENDANAEKEVHKYQKIWSAQTNKKAGKWGLAEKIDVTFVRFLPTADEKLCRLLVGTGSGNLRVYNTSGSIRRAVVNHKVSENAIKKVLALPASSQSGFEKVDFGVIYCDSVEAGNSGKSGKFALFETDKGKDVCVYKASQVVRDMGYMNNGRVFAIGADGVLKVFEENGDVIASVPCGVSEGGWIGDGARVMDEEDPEPDEVAEEDVEMLDNAGKTDLVAPSEDEDYEHLDGITSPVGKKRKGGNVIVEDEDDFKRPRTEG